MGSINTRVVIRDKITSKSGGQLSRVYIINLNPIFTVHALCNISPIQTTYRPLEFNHPHKTIHIESRNYCL